MSLPVSRRSEVGNHSSMTSIPGLRFTLDEIKRALIADYYAEGAAGEDSAEDYELSLYHARLAVEHFERLRSWLVYVREHPTAWKDPADDA